MKLNDDLVEISISLIHGNGVFANKRIPMGTKICKYDSDLVTSEYFEMSVKV